MKDMFKVMMIYRETNFRKTFMTGFETFDEAKQCVEAFGGYHVDSDGVRWSLVPAKDEPTKLDPIDAENDWEFEYGLVHDKNSTSVDLKCWRVRGEAEYKRVVGILKSEPEKYVFLRARLLTHTRYTVIEKLNQLF